MPDYNYKQEEAAKVVGEVKGSAESKETTLAETKKVEEVAERCPSVSDGTSLSGLIGGLMTLALASLIGFIISIFKRRNKVERNYA